MTTFSDGIHKRVTGGPATGAVAVGMPRHTLLLCVMLLTACGQDEGSGEVRVTGRGYGIPLWLIGLLIVALVVYRRRRR